MPNKLYSEYLQTNATQVTHEQYNETHVPDDVNTKLQLMTAHPLANSE